MMDRITTTVDNGKNAIVLDGSTPGNDWRIDINKYSYVIRGFVADRLAAYEDTGLTPEEVKALQTNNARLYELLELYADNAKLHKLLDEMIEQYND